MNMVPSAEGQQVDFGATELPEVPLFNSWGPSVSLFVKPRRVHGSHARVARVGEPSVCDFYPLISADSPYVSGHFEPRVRLFSKRGSVPSGGFDKGELAVESHDSTTDAKAERRRREVVEVGGSGGHGWRYSGPPDGGPANLRRGGGGAEAEAVPSAGWREVAYALDASGGTGHE